MKQNNPNSIPIINRIESLSEKSGWAVLCTYILALALVSFFHEPWFDEAQSWLIARDMPIKDIMFYMPHYEGHPPLWHMYLAIFAKSKMPYELGLSIATILINAIAMGLLIFKAPFKKIIRYTIPFTYFFFYAYGVVGRCYSLTMLGFVVLAISYASRNTRPFTYVLSMMLICASSAYGIVLCAGIAIVWVGQILHETKLKAIIKDRRFYALLVLFTFALSQIYLILPSADAYASNLTSHSLSIAPRLYYMIVLAPVEATLFTAVSGNYILMYSEIRPNVYIVGFVVFLLQAAYLYMIAKPKKTLLLLTLPYVLFGVFSANVYFAEHHVAIVAYFTLFWLWVSYNPETGVEIPENIMKKIQPKNMAMVKKMITLFPALLICMGLYWNISASILEVDTQFSSAREISEFIDENDFEDRLIMLEWYTSTIYDEEIANINDQVAPAISAYFDENIFYGFNGGDKAKAYTTHIIPTKEQISQEYDRLKSHGAPDILIGYPDLYTIFGGDVTLDDYTLVKIIVEKRIAKDDFMRLGSLTSVYVRDDIAKQYGFEEISSQYYADLLAGVVGP